nr:MAG TPA: regulatory protein [Caudoviricetes sp.]
MTNTNLTTTTTNTIVSNLSDFVEIKDEEVFTTSRIVAEKFGKEHYHVIRDIEVLIKSMSQDIEITNAAEIGCVENNVNDIELENKPSELFIEDTYIDSKGEERKQYLITESGAMLLIMGFTGTRALMVKTQFIKEFTRMKNIINNPAQIIVNTGNAEAITAYGIQMTKIGRMMTDTANKLSKAEQERDIAQKEVQDKTALVNTTLANKNDYYWRKWCEDICHVTTNLANFILKKNKVYNGNSLISKQYADCFKMFLDHSGYPTKVITPKGQQVILNLFQPYMRLELLNNGKYTYNKRILTNLGLI